MDFDSRPTFCKLELIEFIVLDSMLPCSPEIVVEKKAAVTDPEFHREYFARKSSTAEKLSLYSDPPPPFEDSVATEVTSLYGEVTRNNHLWLSLIFFQTK